MRDLDEALRLDPQLGWAYRIRGIVYVSRGGYDRAIRDFDRAIQLGWNKLEAYYWRAEAYRRWGREQQAISDATEAINLQHDFGEAYYIRGRAALRIGRWANALDDFTRVLALDSSHRAANLLRSIIHLGLGRPDAAVADAEAHLRRRGWLDRKAPCAAFLVYLASREARREGDARRILEEAWRRSGGSSGNNWPKPIIRYLCREIPADILLAGASDHQRVTEAHTYIGMDLSRSTRVPEAMKHLHWVRERGERESIERDLALVELRRLEGK